MRKYPDDISRRGILGAGASAGLLGATGLFAQVPQPSRTPQPNSKVSITIGSVKYSYPGGPALPDYRISFRSDGSVNLHYGSIWSPPQPDLGRHTVNINGKDITVPSHGWFQSWTYRSTPLTVKKTPAQIVAANRSFAFGDTGLSLIPIRALSFAGPMDNADVTKFMPGGGGGSDRCLITDYSAHFMRTNDAASMLAQAQAADSIPINYVDENTGKPIDLLKYPLANIYSTYQPFIPRGPKDPKGNYAFSGGWEPSPDHFPSLTYIAFQATQDIGFLYNLQHAANYPSMHHPYASANLTGNPPKAVVSPEQTREIAWGLRNILEAHVATLDAEASGILPADLHPSSYFKKLLDNNLAFYGRSMSDPTRQTFRLIGPDLGHIGQWQCDYLHSTLAFAVLTGHADWTPLFLWTLGNVIARTNGTSGWPPGLCAAYKFSTVPRGENRSQPRFTWKQAFDNMVNPDVETPLTKAEYDALIADPLKPSPQLGDISLMGCYAVLAMADCLDKMGLAAVRNTYPEFDVCLTNVNRIKRSYGRIAERYSVVAGSVPSSARSR